MLFSNLDILIFMLNNLVHRDIIFTYFFLLSNENLVNV